MFRVFPMLSRSFGALRRPQAMLVGLGLLTLLAPSLAHEGHDEAVPAAAVTTSNPPGGGAVGRLRARWGPALRPARRLSRPLRHAAAAARRHRVRAEGEPA